MTLKAAYFAFLGFAERQPITLGDMRNAHTFATATLGIVWPSAGWGHNVACWAELLAAHRTHAGHGYASRRFRNAILRNAEDVYLRWREILRYHKNRAYTHEVQTVRNAAKWLLDQRNQL